MKRQKENEQQQNLPENQNDEYRKKAEEAEEKARNFSEYRVDETKIEENDMDFQLKAIELFKTHFAKPMLLAQRVVDKELVKGKYFSFHHIQSILKFFIG